MEEKKSRCVLRLERDGKYIEEEITGKMLCALFDLQFMMDEGTWETVELNKMDKDLSAFFRIIETFDDAYHGEMIGNFKKGSDKIIWRKKKKDEYPWGKPKWKPIAGFSKGWNGKEKR